MTKFKSDAPAVTPSPIEATKPKGTASLAAPDLVDGDHDRAEAERPVADDDRPPGTIAGQCGQRLHVSTLWLPCLESLAGMIVPIVIGLLLVPFGILGLALAGFALVSTAGHVFRYATFRYHVTGREIVLQSGIVHRRERRIPFDRVQETRIHQGLLHRLLGLARLAITTAGSDVKEASLNVISRQTAERVKATIDGRQGASNEDAGSEPYEFSCRLSSRDLILGGLTSNVVASIGAVLAAIIYFYLFLGVGAKWVGNMESKAERQIQRHIPPALDAPWLDLDSRIPDLGPLNFAVDLYREETLAKSLILAGLGLIGSVMAYVVRYHGFCLTRREQVLSTSYGLLTLHQGSLSRDRVQTLKLEEGLLRRPFGLASIRVDSAGDREQIDEAKKRDVLIPVASRAVAHEIARQAIAGLTDLEPEWRRISRRAIMRGSKKGWLLLALVVIQTYWVVGWYWVVWLPAFPLVYFLNQRWYRHRGYWLGDEHFLSRKGWLNRSTTCLPIKNIQNVTLTQSYFDRRLGLATLSIDTAGQSNTGGGPMIRHLPVPDASDLQRAIAERAGSCEFTW